MEKRRGRTACAAVLAALAAVALALAFALPAHAAGTHTVSMWKDAATGTNGVEGFVGEWITGDGETEPGTVTVADGEACDTDPTEWVDDDEWAGNFAELSTQMNADGKSLSWECSADGGVTWSPFSWDDTVVTTDLVVRGTWVADSEYERVKVTFSYGNDGDDDTETVEVAKGGTATPSRQPSRPGYVFDGWTYEVSGVEQPFAPGVTQLFDDADVEANWSLADSGSAKYRELPELGHQATGKCDISKKRIYDRKSPWGGSHTALFKVSGMTGELKDASFTGAFEMTSSNKAVCFDHGSRGITEGQSNVDYRAIVTSVDKDTGKATYLVLVFPRGHVGAGSSTSFGYTKASDSRLATVTFDHVTFTIKSDGTATVKKNTGKMTKKKKQRAVCMMKRSFGQFAKVRIAKASSNPTVSAGNGCYDLAGATYGVYKTRAQATSATAQAPGSPVARLVTGSDGMTPESANLSLGTYYVKELSPAKGFELDGTVHEVKASDGGKTYRVDVTDKPAMDPAEITIQKLDRETGEAYDLSGADLAGAQFEVSYYDAQLSADGEYDSVPDELAVAKAKATWTFETKQRAERSGYIDLTQESYKVSGPELYKKETGRIAYPLGTYVVRETKAPKGYKASSKVWVRHVSQSQDFTAVDTFQDLDGGSAVQEQAKRGDLRFVKKDVDTNVRMPGIPFLVTSMTTGEAHVVVTGENGIFDTTFTEHTANTNANDQAVTGLDQAVTTKDGEVSVDPSKAKVADDGRLDASAGTWFGTNANGTHAPVDDSLGSLPFDTYRIDELSCKANEGFDLVKDLTATVSKDGYLVDFGTIDEPRVQLATTLTAAGAKAASMDGKVTLTDTVAYDGATPGRTYELSGHLMAKRYDNQGRAYAEAVRDANGNAVEATTTFVAKQASGHAEVTFSFDATGVAHEDMVAFEYLYHDGHLVSSHADVEDADQTVSPTAPQIGTVLSEVSTKGARDLGNDHVAEPDRTTTLVDTVAYQGLSTARAYHLDAVLVDATTKAPVLDGLDATQVDAEALNAWCASLYQALGLKSAPTATVADGVVKWEGGDLAKSGDVDVSALAKALAGDGENAAFAKALVHGTTDLKPKEADGSAKVTLPTFDSRTLAGHALVCLEVLSHDDDGDGTREVSSSEVDAESEPQTVTVTTPAISTELVDATDSDHNVLNSKTARVTDHVSYEGLGYAEDGGHATYRLEMTLMDKQTGKPAMAGDEEITGKVVFSPDEPAKGTVDVESGKFDASKLDGHELVAFERLYKVGAGDDGADELVASHEDIDDASQTVKVGVTGDETPYEKGSDNPGGSDDGTAPDDGVFAKTGAGVAAAIVAGVALVAVAAALGVAAWRRSHWDHDDEGEEE